jgi:hypothetical protein
MVDNNIKQGAHNQPALSNNMTPPPYKSAPYGSAVVGSLGIH